MTTAIFVLGMHRSGTSALTASLGMMGANLGNRLLPGRDDNKKGFFEDVRCVSLNIQILRAFHTTGYGGVALPNGWQTAPVVAKGTRRARSILADLGKAPVYALKDPRLSLLGDMWFAAARELGHEVKCIIAVRHPLQVARSLEKRQRVLRYAGYLMWVLYNVESMAQSAPYPRCFVTFEDLQNDTRATLSRLANFVGDKEHFLLDDQRFQQVTDFLDPSLVSTREDVDQQYKQIGEELAQLYQALRAGQAKRFTHLMGRGSLRMFAEMTKSYRQYIVRLRPANSYRSEQAVPAAEAAGTDGGPPARDALPLHEAVDAGEEIPNAAEDAGGDVRDDAASMPGQSAVPDASDEDDHAASEPPLPDEAYRSKYAPLIAEWRRAGESGMTLDDLAVAAGSAGVVTSRNSLRSLVGNMTRAGNAVPVGDRYVWRDMETTSPTPAEAD